MAPLPVWCVPRPRAGPTTLTARAAEAESRRRLRWRERGGPPAAVPASRGFGTRFVEFAAARELGGRAELIFSPEGLEAEVAVLLG